MKRTAGSPPRPTLVPAGAGPTPSNAIDHLSDDEVGRLLTTSICRGDVRTLDQIFANRPITALKIRDEIGGASLATRARALPGSAIHTLTLASLELSADEARVLLTIICDMPQLVRLRLQDVLVHGDALPATDDLPRLQALATLEAAATMNANASPLVGWILERAQLNTLVLDGHRLLSTQQHGAVAAVLGNQGSLCCFEMRSLSSEAVECYLAFVKDSPSLASLCIEKCSVEPAVCNALIGALRDKTTLQEFALTQCELSTPEGAEAVELAPLAELPCLLTLSLQGSAFNEGVLARLLRGLEDHGSLHTLELNGVPLDSAGLEALASLIGKNRRIAKLLLDACSDDELGPLADALQGNVVLWNVCFESPVQGLRSYPHLQEGPNANALKECLDRNNRYRHALAQVPWMAALAGGLHAVLSTGGVPREIAVHAAQLGYDEDARVELAPLALINKQALQTAREAEEILRNDVHDKYLQLAKSASDRPS